MPTAAAISPESVVPANCPFEFFRQGTAFCFIQKPADLDLLAPEGNGKPARVPANGRRLQDHPCPCAWTFPVFLWLPAALFHGHEIRTHCYHFAYLAT